MILKTHVYKALTVALWLTVSASSCTKHKDGDTAIPDVAEQNEQYSGGLAGTNFDTSIDAFGHTVYGLNEDEHSSFQNGHTLFKINWVTAPASTTAIDGVGPIFNTRTCSGCHSRDGRGRAPIPGETGLTSMLIRLSIPGQDIHGGPLEDPNYGTQLSNGSILGVNPEGDAAVAYTEIPGKYPDGTPYSLRNPKYSFINLNYGNMDPNIMFSPRVGNQMYGLGLLEAVPASTILSYADENDANKDGVSGRPNYVWNQKTNQTEMGRFGWKANQPTIDQQIADAFLGDMGITSSLNPDQNLIGTQVALYGSLPNGGTPEIDDADLSDMVYYVRTIAVPGRRNWTDPQVLAGKKLFMSAKCQSCHISQMTTGTSFIPYLSDQIIRPYTDLLLHDMGDNLADNRPDYKATGNEWRTPPLWGLFLIKTVNDHTMLLHDGRARDFEEAILWHGGEGTNSKNAFMNYNKAQRDALIKFLESL